MVSALPRRITARMRVPSQAERLGHVVIRADLQTEHQVDLLPLAGQHDDGRIDAIAAEVAADLIPVLVGEHQVEQDQIDFLMPRNMIAAPPSDAVST